MLDDPVYELFRRLVLVVRRRDQPAPALPRYELHLGDHGLKYFACGVSGGQLRVAQRIVVVDLRVDTEYSQKVLGGHLVRRRPPLEKFEVSLGLFPQTEPVQDLLPGLVALHSVIGVQHADPIGDELVPVLGVEAERGRAVAARPLTGGS